MTGVIASLVGAGYEVAYAEGNPGWFAILRDSNGRCIVVGFGVTQEQAREHLAQRLGRDESWVTMLLESAEPHGAPRGEHPYPAAVMQLEEIRAILEAFDWEVDDRQYALEEIERIVNGDGR